MNAVGKREILQIKKYPNRRYYDATRSCHVTLHEVYDLIQAGHDVVITDSRTGEDITNLILTQVILERDQPKLDLFPAWILHLIIRSNRQMLRSFSDRAFGPTMDLFATSQRQWETYMRDAMSGRITSPLDWAQTMLSAFSPNHRRPNASTPAPSPSDAAPPDETADDAEVNTLEALRAQIETLMHRIEAMQAKTTPRDRDTSGPRVR